MRLWDPEWAMVTSALIACCPSGTTTLHDLQNPRDGSAQLRQDVHLTQRSRDCNGLAQRPDSWQRTH